MKKTRFIGIIAILAIGSFLFNLADAETEQERLGRMLKQFDNPSAMHGKMTVSLQETITKQQAEGIINEIGAALQKNKVCESAANLGEKLKETGCKNIDSWDDNLKTATVIVLVGQEKILAKKFYDLEEVLWVEPVYEATISENKDVITPQPKEANVQDNEDTLLYDNSRNTEQEPLGNAEQAAIESADVFERFWNWLKNLFN